VNVIFKKLWLAVSVMLWKGDRTCTMSGMLLAFQKSCEGDQHQPSVFCTPRREKV